MHSPIKNVLIRQNSSDFVALVISARDMYKKNVWYLLAAVHTISLIQQQRCMIYLRIVCEVGISYIIRYFHIIVAHTFMMFTICILSLGYRHISYIIRHVVSIQNVTLIYYIISLRIQVNHTELQSSNDVRNYRIDEFLLKPTDATKYTTQTVIIIT